MDSKELFLSGRVITPKDLNKSHYILNAYEKGLQNYRLITNQVIFEKKIERGRGLPLHVWEFLMERGEVIGIANPVRWKSPQLILRAVQDKRFCVFGSQGAFFYGQGMIPSDFKFGDPVVLVEGPLDRDSFIDVYPKTLAVLSSSMSSRQKKILSYMTDKVILAYDNDEVGVKAIERESKNLKEMGIKTTILYHPKGIKDAGTLSEFKFRGKTYEYEDLKQYYKLNMEVLLGAF